MGRNLKHKNKDKIKIRINKVLKEIELNSNPLNFYGKEKEDKLLTKVLNKELEELKKDYPEYFI